MNNGLYEHIEVFLAIAHARSLTGASIATGIGQATISRQLAALEHHLGCTLFQRSTRAINLTERGEAFLHQAQRVIDAMAAAQAAVQEKGSRLQGRLRVACSNGFAKKLLIPLLPEWQALHPEVNVDLMLADHLSQIIEERVDVAFRIGTLPESGLFARPVGSFQHIVVASTEYLKKHGRIARPEHLAQHQCILYSGFEHPEQWHFTGPDSEHRIRVGSRLQSSTFDGVCDAVQAGLGVAATPDWFWRSELADGSIQRLLPDYHLSRRIIHAVTAARPQAGGKTAIFVTFVESRLPQRLALVSPLSQQGKT